MKVDDSKLGTAIAKGIASSKPETPCPELEQIAALADGALADDERDRLLSHLAQCATCRELFVTTSELSADAASVEVRRRYLIPSALAAAAVLLVALTLTLKKTPDEKPQLAKTAEPAAPLAKTPLSSVPMSAATETAAPVVAPAPLAPTARQALSPAADQAPGSRRPEAPLPTLERCAGRLARLARLGSPARLAALLPAGNGASGFAEKVEPDALAFRIGMSSMELEVALLADDGDRAQAQTARLSALLQALLGDEDIADLERLAKRLEQGDKPSSLAGRTGKIERLIPRDQLGFARLGAWAQGARLAAKSGNADYFSQGVPEYFQKRLEQPGAPKGAAAKLRELRQKVNDPRSIDLQGVAEGIEELCKGF